MYIVSYIHTVYITYTYIYIYIYFATAIAILICYIHDVMCVSSMLIIGLNVLLTQSMVDPSPLSPAHNILPENPRPCLTSAPTQPIDLSQPYPYVRRDLYPFRLYS